MPSSIYLTHFSANFKNAWFVTWLTQVACELQHNKTKKMMCAQQRLGSAWASAQSDLSLCCMLNGKLRTQPFLCGQADQSSRGTQVILLVLSCIGSCVYFNSWFHVSSLNSCEKDKKNDLVVLRLNVPVNNFSVMSGRSHRFLGN